MPRKYLFLKILSLIIYIGVALVIIILATNVSVLFSVLFLVIVISRYIANASARKTLSKFLMANKHKISQIQLHTYPTLINKINTIGFEQVKSVHTYSVKEFKNDQYWNEIFEIYEAITEPFNTSYYKYNTGSNLFYILGFYVFDSLLKTDYSNSRLSIAMLHNGQYLIAPLTAITTKKLNKFYSNLEALNIPVYDDKRISYSSFKLTH